MRRCAGGHNRLVCLGFIVLAVVVSGCRNSTGRDDGNISRRGAIIHGTVTTADGRPIGLVGLFAEAKANGCLNQSSGGGGSGEVTDSGEYSLLIQAALVQDTYCIVAHFLPSDSSGLDSLTIVGGDLVFRDVESDQVYDSLRIDAVLPVKR